MFDNRTDEREPLKKLFNLQMGKTPARAEKRLWATNDHRWISIADMSTYGKYTGDTKEYLSDIAVKETGIKIVPKDTVIMSFKLTVGRTAITSEDIYTNEAIMAFLPKSTKFDLDYLRYALHFYDWTEGIQNAVKGVTLNKAIIGDTAFSIPPMELQNEFAKFVAQSDKSKFEIKQCIEKTEKLLHRIIDESIN